MHGFYRRMPAAQHIVLELFRVNITLGANEKSVAAIRENQWHMVLEPIH
jgi:hypothetical protein